jgi:hypothetical protein
MKEIIPKGIINSNIFHKVFFIMIFFFFYRQPPSSKLRNDDSGWLGVSISTTFLCHQYCKL